jgi:glyoxylase-like metal-dependent hydrolase (beta-lactamase superfamily II)
MKEIVPHVYLVEGLRSAHVYLLNSEEGLTLVDAGTPGELGQITAQLEKGGYALTDVKAIVLTHCHADHAGNLAALAAESGAQVLAHEHEVPYVERTASLPASSPLRRVLVWLMDRAFSSPPCKVDRALQDGDVVQALGGLRVIHAPGHTPGNIALYQPQRQILFCGDTIFNGAPFSRKQGIQAPPRFFSVDAGQAERSAKALADLPLEVICFGHGDPIVEGAQEKLREAIKATRG